MLQIQEIGKQYITGDLTQAALDGVSLNLRDNEFVAILGPSGSGKTTLLNIIGGLDRYDRGDLIINGISTKKYKDRDWDSYRNHTVGFVFQSYNLIPHQSILSNVELALTISGIGRAQRRKRAAEALDQVGLGDQLHKRPNQMSGGQMQRVAIARALVNNPDILLADEPTGALDTETSVQVMDLLKEVAKDRLVVMVTHNPELAETYATRIVRLRDGKIQDDTNSCEVDKSKLAPPKHENMGKASMSFLTALSLSFNNLRTKKGRTLLTSFAGSIGIIGISLILALSNGVNDYIADIQKSTMTSYPMTIEAQSIDLSSMMQARPHAGASDGPEHALDGVYSNGRSLEMVSTMTTSLTENNLTEFKKYLDNPDSEIHEYIGENGIVYSYETQFGVYAYDPEGAFVNTDGSSLKNKTGAEMSEMAEMSGMQNMTSPFTAGGGPFGELLPGKESSSVGPALEENYELLYGAWPAAYDEMILVLDENNEIPISTLYTLGMLPVKEYEALLDRIDAGEQVEVETQKLSYEEICEKPFYLIPACDTYVENGKGTFDSLAGDTARLEELADSAVQMKIVGVVRPGQDASENLIVSTLGYTKALTDYLIDYANSSAVVKAQQADKTVNVLNGMRFSPSDDAAKIADAKAYLSNLGVTEKARLCREMLGPMYAGNAEMNAQLDAMGEAELAATLDAYLENPQDDMLLSIYNAYISTGSYEDNSKAFGVVSPDAPSAINIYTDSFEDKDSISACIDSYNTAASEENQITYTDYVGLLMSSVTTMVNVVSYVLIAFVAVSLVVSSIMIGIITYISVLERTKEIGILRAIGASKRNISQVFNAETFIIGLCAGLIGIGVSLLLLIPGNALIHALVGSASVNASLPVGGAVILVLLSMVLTLIGGLIPSKKAAKKDPVTALRTE